MSRTAVSDWESWGLHYRCTFCGADPQVWCVTVSKEPAKYLHGERTYGVIQAFSAGWQEGYEDGTRRAELKWITPAGFKQP